MKTPIQELINQLIDNGLPHNCKTIHLLRLHLTKERQFAETCFNAGFDYADSHSTNDTYFPTFYEQYER